jgi:Protein of unknown function (DUF998)
MTKPRRKRINVTERAATAAGIAGPAAFTGAWIAGSLRQAGHPAAGIQLSGLAAPDARDPWIMLTGFLVLGGCSVAFGAALHEALGGRGRAGLAPRLIQGAGLLTIAAGLLRRDRMLLTAGSVSWHNHAHDAVSAVIYADLVLALALLAVRFGRDPRQAAVSGGPLDPEGRDWRPWRPWLLAGAGATAAALIAFAADTSAPAAGVLQRVAVSIPLAAVAAVAARLLGPAGQPSEEPLAVIRG